MESREEYGVRWSGKAYLASGEPLSGPMFEACAPIERV